nr:BamA/TamA family outer membrane protein [Leptolyngbya sp. Prado105]
IYTRHEKYFLRGQAGYVNFSEHYWGIGNETLPEKEYETLLYQRTYFQPRTLRKIGHRAFGGLNLNYSQTYNIRALDSDWNEQITGATGSTVLGIGPNLTFDHRDNPYSPVRGWYLEATTLHYRKAWGSQFQYNEYHLDFRKYHTLSNRHFLGWQIVGNFADGNVPLRELNRLGGPNLMRGYVGGRYRDRQLLAAQTEYRIPIGRFFVWAAFASIGKVSRDVGDLWTTRDWRLGYGTGIRMLVNKQRKIYSRLDFALNDQFKPHFYFRIFDAF